MMHPEYKEDIMGKHISKKDLTLHHKVDVMKDFNETMLRMPDFGQRLRVFSNIAGSPTGESGWKR